MSRTRSSFTVFVATVGILNGALISLSAYPARSASIDKQPSRNIQSPATTSSTMESVEESLKGMRRIPAPDPGVLTSPSLIYDSPISNGDSDDSLLLRQVPEQQLIPVGRDKLSPIKLEASYTEALTLRQALELARQNNLQVKISQTNFQESKYTHFGALGGFAPIISLDLIRQRDSSGGQTVYANPFYFTTLYPVFLGGGVLFNFLKTGHEMKAAQFAKSSSTNDVLLDVYLRYYDLLLNSALLTIRSKAVEVSEAQMEMNQNLRTAGLGTDFEVMQSKTLLALDKQRLVHQEIEARRCSIQLALALNQSVIENLIPAERIINRTDLVDSQMKPALLTALAVEHRPELARFEQLRLAAHNAIAESYAPLLPQAAFYTNNAVGISKTGDSIVIPTGGAIGTGGVGTGSQSKAADSAFSSGFILNWTLQGGGIESASKVASARIRSQRVMLEAREAFLKISSEVHQAYLDTRAAETDIEVSSEASKTATEEVRMADLRLRHQIGTNLELIQAQKDYIDALSKRVEAYVAYKQSQARLLHAIGLISVDSLVSDHPQHFDLQKSRTSK